jgi:hypothetical protein
MKRRLAAGTVLLGIVLMPLTGASANRGCQVLGDNDATAGLESTCATAVGPLGVLCTKYGLCLG